MLICDVLVLCWSPSISDNGKLKQLILQLYNLLQFQFPRVENYHSVGIHPGMILPRKYSIIDSMTRFPSRISKIDLRNSISITLRGPHTRDTQRD